MSATAPTIEDGPRKAIIRVDSAPRRARRDTVVPVAIRCAWCEGWIFAPTWPARSQVSHGLCPGCRDHLSRAPACV